VKILFTVLLLILHLVYPVCQYVGKVLGYEFLLYSDWGFALFLTVPTVIMAFAAVPGRLAKMLAAAMVLDGIFLLGPGVVLTVCVYVWFLCCIILCFRAAVSWKKMVPVILILTIIAVLPILEGRLAMDIGMYSSQYGFDSPGGRYTVHTESYSYGIMGGIAEIYVRDNSKALNLLIGKLYPPAEKIGTMKESSCYGEKIWHDEHTLQIGDEIWTMP